MTAPTCPTCGEPGIPIVYGFPMGDMWDDEAAGRIVLGGCVVEPRSPAWVCAAGHKWGDPAQRLRVDGAAAVFTSDDPPTE